jgi:8-oxo-dGTP pyrophosphatase MutT (NUDIX family)
MAFTEFLRGKYDCEDTSYIINLLSNMTKTEHLLLKSKTFDELWTVHWGVGRDHHSKEFDTSKERFDTVNLPQLIEGIEGYDESEWGFPKGRRSPRETDIECAIREFTEETNIPRSCYVICKNLILTETFFGTNGIAYRHEYFIAVLREPSFIDLSQTMTELQKREVSAIEWKTIDSCKDLSRPHFKERPELLKTLKQVLYKFELQDNIA